MTKQEELREGIAKILWDIDRPSNVPNWDELKKSTHEQCVMETKNTLIDATHILAYLHSQGVVIKVEKDIELVIKETEFLGSTITVIMPKSFSAVAPLIEEKNEHSNYSQGISPPG
ncbi:MAG TPA: hypothetical protein VMW45_00650 [Dehalococcoidia bacterium]|nr:hypothetical protein [Dehalococcoidia bacterium]